MRICNNARMGELDMHAVVPAERVGWRLDRVLAGLFPQHSRGCLQRWIREGRVRLDGESVCSTRRAVTGGEQLSLRPGAGHAVDTDLPEPIPLQICYEDAELLVVDKPPGLVVHPGAGCRRHTLLNALLHYDAALAAVPRAGIVHRLDKDTSGLLLVARTLQAHTALVAMLRQRHICRDYLAIVQGQPAPVQGSIALPLGRHPVQRTRMAALSPDRLGRPGVRAALTHYRVRESLGTCSLLDLSLATGRTHQLRVHLSAIGHPVVGDPVYGGRRSQGGRARRQMLHACALRLRHPCSARQLQLQSPPPADVQALLRQLREEAGRAGRQPS